MIDHIETDSSDTTISQAWDGTDGGMRLHINQRITRAGDQMCAIRIVVRKPGRQTEAVPVEVHYHGQVGRP